MASLDQARDEAYASAPASKHIYPVVRLDEPSFSEPVYLIAGLEEDTSLTLEDLPDGRPGETVKAIACAFKVTLHGFDEGGPTTAKAEISNVSGELYPQLRKATRPISVEYRAYLEGDFSKPVDVITGYQLKQVRIFATSAEGDLTLPEIGTQAFPLMTYDLETYPGLWNS